MRSLILAIILAASAAHADVRVVTIGDSITYGISSWPHGPGYVEVLDGLLGAGYDVRNIACNGSGVAGWQEPLLAWPCLGRYDDEPIDYWDVLIYPNLPADVVTSRRPPFCEVTPVTCSPR